MTHLLKQLYKLGSHSKKLIEVLFLYVDNLFQRNHSLFGSVWSSMRRGHSFNRAKSLKLNSTQIKITPASSVDYLPYNSIKNAVADGMNHITSMTKNVGQNKGSATSLNDRYHDEEIPLRALTNLRNGDTEKSTYTVIE